MSQFYGNAHRNFPGLIELVDSDDDVVDPRNILAPGTRRDVWRPTLPQTIRSEVVRSGDRMVQVFDLISSDDEESPAKVVNSNSSSAKGVPEDDEIKVKRQKTDKNSLYDVKREFEPLKFGEANYGDEVVEIKSCEEDDAEKGVREAVISVDDECDIECIGGNMNALSDMPHQREACSCFKFIPYDRSANIKFCNQCYCYICDIIAKDCVEWSEHCNASHRIPAFKELQKARRLPALQLLDAKLKGVFYQKNKIIIIEIVELMTARADPSHYCENQEYRACNACMSLADAANAAIQEANSGVLVSSAVEKLREAAVYFLLITDIVLSRLPAVMRNLISLFVRILFHPQCTRILVEKMMTHISKSSSKFYCAEVVAINAMMWEGGVVEWTRSGASDVGGGHVKLFTSFVPLVPRWTVVEVLDNIVHNRVPNNDVMKNCLDQLLGALSDVDSPLYLQVTLNILSREISETLEKRNYDADLVHSDCSRQLEINHSDQCYSMQRAAHLLQSLTNHQWQKAQSFNIPLVLEKVSLKCVGIFFSILTKIENVPKEYMNHLQSAIFSHTAAVLDLENNENTNFMSMMYSIVHTMQNTFGTSGLHPATWAINHVSSVWKSEEAYAVLISLCTRIPEFLPKRINDVTNAESEHSGSDISLFVTKYRSRDLGMLTRVFLLATTDVINMYKYPLTAVTADKYGHITDGGISARPISQNSCHYHALSIATILIPYGNNNVSEKLNASKYMCVKNTFLSVQMTPRQGALLNLLPEEIWTAWSGLPGDCFTCYNENASADQSSRPDMPVIYRINQCLNVDSAITIAAMLWRDDETDEDLQSSNTLHNSQGQGSLESMSPSSRIFCATKILWKSFLHQLTIAEVGKDRWPYARFDTMVQWYTSKVTSPSYKRMNLCFDTAHYEEAMTLLNRYNRLHTIARQELKFLESVRELRVFYSWFDRDSLHESEHTQGGWAFVRRLYLLALKSLDIKSPTSYLLLENYSELSDAWKMFQPSMLGLLKYKDLSNLKSNTELLVTVHGVIRHVIWRYRDIHQFESFEIDDDPLLTSLTSHPYPSILDALYEAGDHELVIDVASLTLNSLFVERLVKAMRKKLSYIPADYEDDDFRDVEYVKRCNEFVASFEALKWGEESPQTRSPRSNPIPTAQCLHKLSQEIQVTLDTRKKITKSGVRFGNGAKHDEALLCAYHVRLGNHVKRLLSEHYEKVDENWDSLKFTSKFVDLTKVPSNFLRNLLMESVSDDYCRSKISLPPVMSLTELLPYIAASYIQHGDLFDLGVLGPLTPVPTTFGYCELSVKEFLVYQTRSRESVTDFMLSATALAASSSTSTSSTSPSSSSSSIPLLPTPTPTAVSLATATVNGRTAPQSPNSYAAYNPSCNPQNGHEKGHQNGNKGYIPNRKTTTLQETASLESVISPSASSQETTAVLASKALHRVISWLPGAFHKGLMPFHRYLKLACQYLSSDAISIALNGLAPSVLLKPPTSVLLDVFPACVQLAGLWPSHGHILYPWAAYLILQFSNISDDIRAALVAMVPPPDFITTHTQGVCGSTNSTFLPTLEDAVGILRVIADPSIANFNRIKKSNRFKEYSTAVLKAVLDFEQPSKCVHALISMGSYEALVDLLLTLAGLNEATLGLVDDLIASISTSLLMAQPILPIPSFSSSNSSSSSSSISGENPYTDVNKSNGIGTEFDPSSSSLETQDPHEEFLNKISSYPLTNKIRIHMELRVKTGFVRQALRLLLALCDLWQFRDCEVEISVAAVTEVRVKLRDKTAELISAIAKAGYNDELLCSILNLASNYTALAYHQLRRIDEHEVSLLSGLYNTSSWQQHAIMAHYSPPVLDLLVEECTSCLAGCSLSVQRQLENIKEFLNILPDCSNHINMIKNVRTVLRSTTYYSPEVTPDGSSSNCGKTCKVRRGMLYISGSSVLGAAIGMLGEVLVNAPPLRAQAINSRPLLTGAEAVEVLLLERLNDHIPSDGMSERSFYALARSMERASSNTYYIRSLLDIHLGVTTAGKLETLIPILASARGREGYIDVTKISFFLLMAAYRSTRPDAKLVLKLLFFNPQDGPGNSRCHFFEDQCTQLVAQLLSDVASLLRAFCDYNPGLPFISVHGIAKHAQLMNLITINLPISKCGIIPQDYVRLVPIWKDLFFTQNANFITSFQHLGESVVSKMATERVSPKLKESFTQFLTHYKSCHMITEKGAQIWARFKIRACNMVKTKKTIQAVINSV